MPKNKKINWALIILICLAAVLRLYRYDQIPPGLFGDEVDSGYQAYSILKTGRDYFGHLLPIHFQSFGDWRMPLYIYATVPFVGIFGLTEAATRLPSLIFSILFILTTYGVTIRLTGQKKTALLASFLLALSPWQFHFSRVALEVTLYGGLFLVGVWFFLHQEWSDRKRLVLSCAAWGLSVYAYSTAKLFIPLWVAGLILLSHRRIRGKEWLLPLAVFALIVLPMGFESAFGQGKARFRSISVFSQPVAEEVVLARQECAADDWQERFFHNKGWAWSKIVFKSYVQSFSAEYLFLGGDPSLRHNPFKVGQLNPLLGVLIPFGVYGFARQFRKRKDPLLLLPFWALLLTPFPAALTQGGGTHAIRTYQFLPWWQILAAAGAVEILGLVGQRWRFWLAAILAGGYAFFAVSFFHQYFFHFNRIEWRRWWNEGYREVFEYLNPRLGSYDEVWFSPAWEPPIVFVMFYNRFPPREAQAQMVVSPDRLGKFVFRSFDFTADRKGDRKLLISTPGELLTKEGVTDVRTDSRLRVLGLIYNQSRELVFYIFQLVSL